MMLEVSTKSNAIIKESKELKLSYRFGFFGIGMGGTSIGTSCANITTQIENNKYPYTALLVNSTEVDHKKVQAMTKNPTTELLLIGEGKGAGREINVGESLYKNNDEKITNAVKKKFSDVDFVWIVVGLGGGTGTGGVIQAIGTLMKNGFNKRFGLILTLPRLQEGRTVINNALQRLRQIYAAMENLGPIILVDNQKLLTEYMVNNPNGTLESYIKYSNEYVAEALHELNAITASYIPNGDIHFDSSEFEKMLKTPGLFHFARFSARSAEIDALQEQSYIDKIRSQIENGVLSEGYDLRQARRSAISVLSHKSIGSRLYTGAFRSSLEKLLNEVTPLAKEKPAALYHYETEKQLNFIKQQNSKEYEKHSTVYFYAIVSGLDLPEERISELMEEDQRLAELEKELENRPKKNLFAGLAVNNNDTAKSNDVSFDDLFGGSSSEVDKKDEQIDDVFAMLGLDDK